jgi:hypothetical protein
MKKEWIYLLVYYTLLLLIPLGDRTPTFLVVLTIGLSLLFMYFYKVIGDEILFYVYNFIAILGTLFALMPYNPYSPLTIGIAYLLLTLILLHMTYARFLPLFGSVRRDTIIYTILSAPMAYLSIYLFLIYPIGYGFVGMLILIVLIIIFIYFLMRSPKSQERGNAA